AYGSEAWSNFQDPRRRPSEHDAMLFIVGDEKLAHTRTSRTQQEGDHASAPIQRGIANVRMVKTKQGWFVDGETFVPAGTDGKETADKLLAMAAAVRKLRRAIGKPDVPPTAIDAELGLALEEIAVGRKIDAPHRFDIDKL